MSRKSAEKLRLGWEGGSPDLASCSQIGWPQMGAPNDLSSGWPFHRPTGSAAAVA